MTTPSTKNYKSLITILSIIIPIAVAVLFKVHINVKLPIFLPPIYATLNGLTAILLVMAVVAIKKGNINAHQKYIKTALACSALFLIMYVLYHMTSTSTKFGGEGIVKYIYFFILITHIILSIGVIPLVLTTFVRGLNRQDEKHKKIAKYTFPLWLYVAVTGVIVYLMIHPYY